MTFYKLLAATVTGLMLALGSVPTDVQAQTIQVVRKGTERDLKINMNQGIVVESDIPFTDISIANPAIADLSTLSDRTLYLLGISPGRTTLSLFDATGQLIANVEVRVSADVTEFKERLQQILPNEKIEVRTANDGIVLSGTVSSVLKMDRALELAQRYAPERVSNLMSVSGKQQVLLKVRFAEMQRAVTKQLSSSVGILSPTGNVSVLGETGTFLAGENSIAGLFDAEAGPIITSDGVQGALGFGLDLGATQVGILLEALETKGIVRTLAEPNLTALSGQEATFLAGGEVPVPANQEDGVVTIEFRPFGVELNFVPRVLDDGIINLELAAAVSAIDATAGIISDGIVIPGFTRRDTSTTVAMRDGQSFAIAGLLQDDFQDNAAQIPFLGDVPVLGALFRSADYQREQTELVIIITAHLVTPTTGEALALPTDRVRLPSDREFFLNGRIAIDEPPESPVGEVARQDFQGSYGYILE